MRFASEPAGGALPTAVVCPAYDITADTNDARPVSRPRRGSGTVARTMRTDQRVSGLRWLGVEHEGIRTSSTEESEEVSRVCNALVGGEGLTS